MPADIPPIERRPILDLGLGLVALVVVCCIILAVIEAFGSNIVFIPATENPWPAVAWLCLAFCIPTVIATVSVVLRDLLVPRIYRYACLACSTVSLVIVGTIASLACFGDPDAYYTFSDRVYLDGLLGPWGILWMAAAGVLFGFSLPTVHGTERERRFVRRSRRQVTLYVLLGLCLAIMLYLFFLVGPPSELGVAPWSYETVGWIPWFRDLVVLPAVAYQASCLAVCIVGRIADVRLPPRRLRRLMVSIPLVAWAAVAFGGALAGGTGLPEGGAWIALVSCVFAVLGVPPGIVIASMRD